MPNFSLFSISSGETTRDRVAVESAPDADRPEPDDFPGALVPNMRKQDRRHSHLSRCS
jgi:hypothetical protein